MNIHPSKSEFEALARQGNSIPVYLELTADCETPLGAYSKIRENGPAFLFESIVGGERISRYSFLGSNPRKVFRVFEDETTITTQDGNVDTLPTPADPLTLIEAEMGQYKPVEIPGMPPSMAAQSALSDTNLFTASSHRFPNPLKTHSKSRFCII